MDRVTVRALAEEILRNHQGPEIMTMAEACAEARRLLMLEERDRIRELDRMAREKRDEECPCNECHCREISTLACPTCSRMQEWLAEDGEES